MPAIPLLLFVCGTVVPAALGANDPALIARGAYVARLGDCAACHTADDGPFMAGGLALSTPFGVLRSTNITPDPRTGIGGYTFEQFDGAVRRGVRADGTNLYPAMPYPSYARTSLDDVRALYAWIMRDVRPIERRNEASHLRWPFSMRWGLSLWNWAFLDMAPFQPDAGKDATWNRGAYLVQGFGHCGACHTPRGIALQEKAMSESGRRGTHYLAGATIDGWHALSLRNLSSVEDATLTLRTGQNRFGAVSGNMVEVIHGSTQHFTDSDRTAIAAYLKSLPPTEGSLRVTVAAGRTAAPTIPADLFTTRGGLGYVQFCATCHRQDGGGVQGIFPPLSLNPTVTATDPATLLHITLTGWKTAATAATPRVYTMPSYARLSDAEIAEILTFVRANWGDRNEKVSPADVRNVRTQLDSRVTDSSVFETPRFADMLASPNAHQLVRGMRLHRETDALLPDHVGASASCASCHLNAGTVANGSPFVGLAAFFPSYNPRAGRIISLEERINGCFKRSMNGKPLPADSTDLKAMVAYFEWMKREATPNDKVVGRGVGKVDERIRPNVENGKALYAAQCAVCHGDDGEGLKDAGGRLVFPPVWGEQAFNIGAGVARTYTAAAFVKSNMPIGSRDQFPLGQGGLSDQDAVDVAEYFSHQPRPDFPEKVLDWPKDRKPGDSRY